MSADAEDGEDGSSSSAAPGPDPDIVATGAAADAADDEAARLKGLPRILRYAMLFNDGGDHLEYRLIAEIDELCPGLSQNAMWAQALDTDSGIALADELDRLAVIRDTPDLRGLADSVRLLSLPPGYIPIFFGAHRRVARALTLAFMHIASDLDDERRCDLEQFVNGWAALPAVGTLVIGHPDLAARGAIWLGERLAQYRVRSADARAADRAKREGEDWQNPIRTTKERDTSAPSPAEPAADMTPAHHLIVGRMDEAQMKSSKVKDIVGPIRHVLNAALPVIRTPLLHDVRTQLMREFPYAESVIDFALADLVGRATVKLRPLLLVGDPGGGKSRFARRLGEILGLTVWRTDASQADGTSIAGTDRRWYSAEPCHPMLAIARGKNANPMMLLDELEKAATRTDYGRLWDCLLGFLEPETAARYQDPALQIPLDLSQVSYVATANSLDPLPGPIRDRFRIVTFPKPTASDLDALLPALLAGLAAERGLDARWVAPLDDIEHAAVATAWNGGSVRRLRRIIEVILHARERNAVRH